MELENRKGGVIVSCECMMEGDMEYRKHKGGE